MERILRHTMQGISLDTDTLSQMANALASNQEHPREPPLGPEEVDGLPIDDEACTIDPVEDTTTRSCPSMTAVLINQANVCQIILGNSHTGTFPCASNTRLNIKPGDHLLRYALQMSHRTNAN